MPIRRTGRSCYGCKHLTGNHEHENEWERAMANTPTEKPRCAIHRDAHRLLQFPFKSTKCEEWTEKDKAHNDTHLE